MALLLTPKKAYYACCVIDCPNNTKNEPVLEFYKFPSGNILFPHKAQRRAEWLKRVNLQNDDGSPWLPRARTRLCSQHFVGNKKSEDPRSPSFHPTIFPEIYEKRKVDSAVALYKRAMKRKLDEEIISEF